MLKRILLAILAATISTIALAADNLPFPVKALGSSPCTIAQCSGAYGGFGLTGNGTNVDIIGNGINQSVFAAGGIIDVHAGYQLWNGSYFAAIEAGIGNQFQQTQPLSSLGAKSLIGYERVKFGIGLAGPFNQPTGIPTGSQAPAAINIPASLAAALISPYFTTGALQRNGVSQWTNGVGTEFLLASHWNLNIEYNYGAAVNSTNPISGVPAINLVTMSLNYHF